MRVRGEALTWVTASSRLGSFLVNHSFSKIRRCLTILLMRDSSYTPGGNKGRKFVGVSVRVESSA